MVFIGFVLQGISAVLSTVLFFAFILLIARAILSWVSPDPRNPIVSFIYGATEPVLMPIRRKIPPIGMFDLSLLVLLLGIMFLQRSIVPYLEKTGYEWANSSPEVSSGSDYNEYR